MKKLLNTSVKITGKLCSVLTQNDKVLFSGKKVKCFCYCEGFPLVWILQDNKNVSHVFIEDVENHIVWVAPQNICKVCAQRNYILFEQNGKWWGQYFCKNEKIFLGDPINLKDEYKLENFLFVYPVESGYILTCAAESKIEQNQIKSFEKIQFLGYACEALLVESFLTNKLFLYSNYGKFSFNHRQNLFFTTGKNKGLILTYNRHRNCFYKVYSGKYLQKYKADELYRNGCKLDTSEQMIWSSNLAFVVPDKNKTVSGTLYYIKGTKIQEVAKGDLSFVSCIISYTSFFTVVEKVIVNGRTFFV